MPITYPLELKIKTIHRYEQGESLKSLSEELHIAQSTLYHWQSIYCTIHTKKGIYTPKEIDALSLRLQKLEHEMEIIRLSGYLTSVPLQKKLATMEYFYNQPDSPYSVHELCDALCVARGTFYNHIFRRVDKTKYEDEQEKLARQIKQVFDDSEQRFGAKKIHAVLQKNGVRVSAKRIAATMQELGLYSIRVDSKKIHRKKQLYSRQNLLKGVFSADHPNQVWVSDITYFKIKGYWVYLCIILDLYSRKIVGWKVSRHISTRLVTSTFRVAFQERDLPSSLTFHSDRGSQYTSKTFSELLRQHNVKQSFSATAKPLDNAVAEAFFSTFKREEAYRTDYTSEQHFRRSVDEYIRFYNELRPHETLHYRTPQEFEASHIAVFSKNSV